MNSIWPSNYSSTSRFPHSFQSGNPDWNQPNLFVLVLPSGWRVECLEHPGMSEKDIVKITSICCPFQMYGRYTKDLSEFAKEEAYRLKVLERKRRKEDRLRNKDLQKYRGKFATRLIAGSVFVWRHTFAKLGEDWVFLALLGIIMALLSFFMDRGISMCNKGKVWPTVTLLPEFSNNALRWSIMSTNLVSTRGWRWLLTCRSVHKPGGNYSKYTVLMATAPLY